MSAQASLPAKITRSLRAAVAASAASAPAEVKDVEELANPRTPVIYEVVRRLGEEEMARPFHLTMVVRSRCRAFDQFLAVGAGHSANTSARCTAGSRCVTSFGYCIGFIMAVLSRQQLFTESTITAVLPVVAEFTWENIGRMARLWAIVLAANLAGTLFAALFLHVHTGTAGAALTTAW